MGKPDKALYTTDAHVKSRQPKNRTDNFKETMLRKLKFICSYLDKHLDIKYWLDGGDFFDSNSQNCKLINEIIEVFKTMKRTDLFPILMIPGNHLVKGNEILSIKQSGIQTLQEAGFVKILDDPWIEQLGEYRVMLHHHAIVPEEVPWSHLTYEDVASTDTCDYCLCSHYHTPAKPITVEDTTFVIPGSLSRGTGTEKNMHRRPQFAVINLEGEKLVKYVACDKEQYPFPEKAISKALENVSQELVNDIKQCMEGYDSNTMGFREVSEVLQTNGVISPECNSYLEGVFEEIS